MATYSVPIPAGIAVPVHPVVSLGSHVAWYPAPPVEPPATTFSIDGLEVPVLSFKRLADLIGGAGLRRGLNGGLRKCIDWRRRVWEVDAYAPTDVDAVTLRETAADGTRAVQCNGPLIGGLVEARATITDDGYTRVRGGWFRVVTLRIEEN